MELSNRAEQITPSSTLAITAKANELKSQGHDVIGLAAGEPDYNTPNHIIQAATEAAKNGHTKYTPSGGMPALKEAIKDKFQNDQGLNYETNNIIVTTGAKHALYLTFQALINPGDEVIIPAPYWVSYPEQVKLAGGNPVVIPALEDHHFRITVDQLRGVVTEKTKALVINSPSNPTGMIYKPEELKAIGKFCLENGITVVSDEIYETLIYDGAEVTSMASLSPELKDNTVIINGVSKSHAMTGWRIGYAAGPSDMIKAMTNIASHSTSNPASISQHAALAAYTGPQEPLKDMRDAFEERLNYAFERVINIPGLACIKPKGAFYLFPNARKASEMCGFNHVSEWVKALLEEQKVGLVPGEGFGAPDYVRLSYAISLEQMKEALDRINQFMEDHI
ncbi:pyridoxal phosphate-dependent aminotransferase [Tuberibacillus sp. Marseille-P3662]|uniref:pyridoxal phosphate-dependent aminotransferase n=1 Tax=Tuberibacillus sp. Marseille-P3662 TaxID=1965358 RepID=UPI000A1CB8C8|nr:pyridoxal phosphate-dependent aminotransferase [Tuberibacillus sp. Marseille-P3662]